MSKTILLALLGVIVIAIVAVLGIATTKSDTFEVRRSVSVKAPPEKIYPLLEDFHRWSAWSPWEKLDPSMQRSFSGPSAGKGAVYAWQGSGKVGAGRMEIVEATPPSKIAIDLQFLKPIEGRDLTTFALEPKGEDTAVTWTMKGPNPFLAKVMQVFFNAEKMVGEDFERGLAALKAAAEK
jgi:uncharacterized protein YndB with AHSA1/START domain